MLLTADRKAASLPNFNFSSSFINILRLLAGILDILQREKPRRTYSLYQRDFESRIIQVFFNFLQAEQGSISVLRELIKTA